MLKEFRSIDVYWDKATRRIYEEIRSSSSDEKGRKLTVQIVNDGQIQDLTNVALNLYWETQDGENRGLDPFEPLDAENGIYELYFRTGMLEHVGKLNAHLHLVDTTGAITSEPFTIVVFEGVDVDAMASEDELSALTQALVQVNNLETTYAPRLNAVEGSVDSLTDDVALNKSNIVSNTQDIVNLDGRLTTVEQNIAKLNSFIYMETIPSGDEVKWFDLPSNTILRITAHYNADGGLLDVIAVRTTDGGIKETAIHKSSEFKTFKGSSGDYFGVSCTYFARAIIQRFSLDNA